MIFKYKSFVDGKIVVIVKIMPSINEFMASLSTIE